jgi:hypothetical protein
MQQKLTNIRNLKNKVNDLFGIVVRPGQISKSCSLTLFANISVKRPEVKNVKAAATAIGLDFRQNLNIFEQLK